MNMRSGLYLLFVVVLVSCNKPADHNALIRELKDHYHEIAVERFENARETHRWGHELRLKDAYHNGDKQNDALVAMTSKLDKMFRVVEDFCAFADSLSMKHAGDEQYPVDQLLVRYGNAIDSLNAYHRINETKLRVTDYKASAFVHSPEITAARMKAEIAENGYHAMYAFIDVTAPHTIYDDFSLPSTKQLFKQGSAYGFTIHYRAGQRSPYMEVAIDTVMRNGRIITKKAFTHHDDVLWVVNFNKLKKGNYVVKGRVKSVNDQVDVRPFTHRFQVL